MAVKKTQVLEIQKKHKLKPLTEKELIAISIVEKIIDDKILKTCQYGEKIIYIELGYVNFNYKLEGIEMTPDMRPDRMRTELDKRYKKSGWNIRVDYDDGLDGPNMSGPDYWILY
jgi:hypothetical protein